MSVEIIVADDEKDVGSRAAAFLADAARNGGHIALSGGRTPEHAHREAAKHQPDWSKAELWWGDERCVPPHDENSNYGMAKRTLLDNLAQQPRAVHRIRGEADPDEAAGEYDAALHGIRLSLNVLGLGPDGHTASLFPNASGLDERERLAITQEPKLDPMVMRITMTPPMLSNADLVLFLVAGEEKAEAAARAFGGPESRATPASSIRSQGGRTVVIFDRPAAALLEA